MKKVTIYTLAEELGMTPSMVSRALNPNGKVNEQKRQLVLKTAEKYNFVPNKMASRLSGKPLKIGVLLNTHFEPIRKELADGIYEAYSALKDYKIEYELFMPKNHDSRSELCGIADKLKSCDGTIISGYASDTYSDILARFSNLVFVQTPNEHVDYLFSSEHDMSLASEIAAEFLSDCLMFSSTKNIVLFTGNRLNSIHAHAEASFCSAAAVNGLHILNSIDMHDDEAYLTSILPKIFKQGNIDGVYITSGFSLPLCRYAKENKLSIPIVTFDVYSELNKYIKEGIVSATIFQNAKAQAKTAFENLVRYLTDGGLPEKKLLTSVQPVMKSNLRMYE